MPGRYGQNGKKEYEEFGHHAFIELQRIEISTAMGVLTGYIPFGKHASKLDKSSNNF